MFDRGGIGGRGRPGLSLGNVINAPHFHDSRASECGPAAQSRSEHRAGSMIFCTCAWRRRLRKGWRSESSHGEADRPPADAWGEVSARYSPNQVRQWR